MNHYDFGYTWPWTFGHLYFALGLAAVAWFLRRVVPKWILYVLGAVALWAFCGFLIIHFVLGFNSLLNLPTHDFLTGNRGQVLDIGCGSGRATIMVGLARPGVALTALDNFSADYIRNNGEELLRKNLRIAGINDRVNVLSADMRKIPLPDASLEGVVSTYAIDHLPRVGIEQTLAEVSRTLKPGGEFLLVIIRADGWLKFTYGPLMHHMRFIESNFWPDRLEAAHLKLIERGAFPGSAYYLSRKQ